ncbi:MAG TPA: GGDEF domain-containing protein [Burkholderiales bacterium]|nr:GGDEF domain-containing protein [Burkholderiales bacterium]
MEQSIRKIQGVTQETVATARHSRRDLAQIGLLKGAHQEGIMPLLRNCPVLLMENGDVLLAAGESCDAVYMVMSGRLRMQDPSGDVADILVDAGDTIGELSLFQNAVLASTVSAIESSRVVVVERKIAWALIGASHQIARNWLALLASRSRVNGVIAGSEELKTTHGGHATLDEVTGLHNRRWLEGMLPRQMTRSATSQEPLTLLLVEIDKFHGYTQRLGPTVGDHACHAVAQTLVESIRPTDLVASYGPAQFAVVLPDSNVAGACQVGERLRHAVSKLTVGVSDDNAGSPLTVSVGVTAFQPTSDARSFLATGEAALKAARISGGNRVGMYRGKE